MKSKVCPRQAKFNGADAGYPNPNPLNTFYGTCDGASGAEGSLPGQKTCCNKEIKTWQMGKGWMEARAPVCNPVTFITAELCS